MTRPAPGLASWLLDPSREPPPAELLRAANLAAYAYTTLPATHPARAALRGDYLAALARHQRIKAELLALLRAWNAAGVEPLLFKGFQLAELVYPVPGMRFHGDVDVLVRPEQVAPAIAVARRLGWVGECPAQGVERRYLHDACTLHGPGGATCLDLHRWVLHSRIRWHGVQRRVTAAVRARAACREWEGVRIRVLDPVDALLVGVVLQRCWGGDAWGLKSHDLLDFRYLSERCGVTRAALEARAGELRAGRTLALFLQRCDPWARVLDLTPPGPRDRRRWNRAAVADRGLVVTYGPALARVPRIPRALGWVLRGLPSLVAARRALARGRALPLLLASLGPRAARPAGSVERRDRLVAGILRGARLFPRNREGDCLLRALALCHVLWREGWPAVFVSGVRRAADGVQGHAWVELDGQVLPALQEPANRALFAVSLEYPAPAARAAIRSVARSG